MSQVNEIIIYKGVEVKAVSLTLSLDAEQHLDLLKEMDDSGINIKKRVFTSLLKEKRTEREALELEKKKLELKERELNQNAA